jgi:DNA (cytosine-5)-methyltransferase 1
MPGQTFIELFAGIGGFRIALERQGFTCLWANEMDAKACDVYESQWPDGTLVRGDINDVDIRKIPKHDVLVGGFPCQPFSYAGSHGGFSDTRGTLFFKIAEILKIKRPKSFIFENVKGLLSHDSGRTFSTILCTLDELGYDAEWRVLNSKDFGVPQNRERVYITGYLRGGSSVERPDNTRKKQRKIAA